jgi:hypothetical protein
MTAQGLSSTRQVGRGGVHCPSPRRPPGSPRGAPAPPPPMSCSQRPCEGATTHPVRETQQQGEKVVSGDVGGADVRDRVLRRGARERWRMCGVVRPRRRLPLRPFPCPRPVDRFATKRRCPERRVRNAAHHIPLCGCCWRDQREDLGVGPFVRAVIQEAHPLAWSIACGGLRVGRTRRGQHGPWQRAARQRARSCSSKAPRAAAAVHVVHGTW